MKASSIVVGFDSTEQAKAAVAQALDAGSRAEACEIHLIESVQEGAAEGSPPLQKYDHGAEQRHAEARLVAYVKQELDVPANVTFRDHARLGDPAKAILRPVAELEADMIFVGTHARKGVERFFLGSVAERVVRYASCPVLMARPRDYRARALPADED